MSATSFALALTIFAITLLQINCGHESQKSSEDSGLNYTIEYISDPERAIQYEVDFEALLGKPTRGSELKQSANDATSVSWSRLVSMSFSFPVYLKGEQKVLVQDLLILEHAIVLRAKTNGSHGNILIAPLCNETHRLVTNSTLHQDNGRSFHVQWSGWLRKRAQRIFVEFQVSLFEFGDIVVVYKSLPVRIKCSQQLTGGLIKSRKLELSSTDKLAWDTFKIEEGSALYFRAPTISQSPKASNNSTLAPDLGRESSASESICANCQPIVDLNHENSTSKGVTKPMDVRSEQIQSFMISTCSKLNKIKRLLLANLRVLSTLSLIMESMARLMLVGSLLMLVKKISKLRTQ